MVRVTVKIKVQNWDDLTLLAAGSRKEPARTLQAEALVDTGAVKFYLQSSLVRSLGLRPISTVQSRTMSDRTETRRVCSPVDLEIQGRSCLESVIEVSDSLPNIVGQIPLEDMDWVVDLQGRRLIPNPEHKEGVLYDEF